MIFFCAHVTDIEPIYEYELVACGMSQMWRRTGFVPTMRVGESGDTY